MWTRLLGRIALLLQAQGDPSAAWNARSPKTTRRELREVTGGRLGHQRVGTMRGRDGPTAGCHAFARVGRHRAAKAGDSSMHDALAAVRHSKNPEIILMPI